MNRRIRTVLLGAFAATTLATFAGCETTGRGTTTPMAAATPTISLTASTRQLVAGEIATFTTQSQNTLGRDAHVEWISTGGQLQTEDNGQTARAFFDQPGAYTVTAILVVDGREVDRDSATVNVRPLR